MFFSMLLVYLGIGLFLYLTLKNKKPIKWSKFFDVISFKSNLNDDIYNIPGPTRLPFIGTTWLKYFQRDDKIHENYEKLNQKYGDIVLEVFGSVNIVNVFKQQDIEKVLDCKTRYPFRPPVEITCMYRTLRSDRYSSVGLTNSNGPLWNTLRSKMTSRSFENAKLLSQFFPSQLEICNDLIAELKACRNEKNIISNVDDILRLFAFESSSTFIIGKRMGAFGSSKTTIGAKALDLAEATRHLFKFFTESYYGNQLWRYFPSFSKLYQDYAKTEEICYEIVENLISEVTKGGLEDDGSPLMTMLMSKGLDDKEKIAGVVDFFVAGTDILQTALMILVHLISLRPDCQKRICEETKDFGDYASLEEIKEAHFTRAVMMESFRLCPSAFALARIAEAEINLSGYNIKPGTLILNHTSVACKKEENFPNPRSFLPERWINEDGEFDMNLNKGAAICLPFGIGKRRCPGEKYAEYMLIFFVSKLVKAFEVEVLGEMETVFEFIVRAKTPVDIVFRDRAD